MYELKLSTFVTLCPNHQSIYSSSQLTVLMKFRKSDNIIKNSKLTTIFRLILISDMQPER